MSNPYGYPSLTYAGERSTQYPRGLRTLQINDTTDATRLLACSFNQEHLGTFAKHGGQSLVRFDTVLHDIHNA